MTMPPTMTSPKTSLLSRTSFFSSSSSSSFHLRRRRRRRTATTTTTTLKKHPLPLRAAFDNQQQQQQQQKKEVISHFINLKNGIEALPMIREHFSDSSHHQIHFMRMQSTLCERGDMEKIMLEVDSNLLLKLATDAPCVIYDYGSRSEDTGLPRSFWYGLESMMYFLRYEWGFDGYGEEEGDEDGISKRREVVLRGKKCTKEIERKRTFFSKSLKKKLRYYRQFIPETHSKELRVIGAYKFTVNDGDREYYKKTLHEHLNMSSSSSSSSSTPPPSASSRSNLNSSSDNDDNSLEATATKLESLGFKIFRGGDREQEWLDMIKSSSS